MPVGGLEHTNSTALLWRPFSYFGKDYKNFLSLLAHEYFHLWNVKRIRPVALGPFDYDNENYTTSLWISEGFTQNYDDYITHRAGIYTAQEYLDILADNISKYESNTGKEVQTVAESSFDAWIKYYRRNENTNNTQISYYDKGAFVALMLNLMIMNESNGEKSLNNVMKDLWENYKYNTNRGFTENEIQQILQKYTNEPMQAFLSNYVFGKKDLDYEKYLNYVGLTLIDKSIKEVKLGAKWNDKFIITETPRNTPAYISGLNVNDEIIAINNIRIKNNNDIETRN
jgi:predicted metalloprotease with PDZ domain